MDDAMTPQNAQRDYARLAGQYLIFLGLLNLSITLAKLVFHDHLDVNLTILLLIWAGWGILRHREGFRKGVCLAAFALTGVTLLSIVCYGFFSPKGSTIELFALQISDPPYWIVVLQGVFTCALVLLPAYWLTRPHVAGQFTQQGDPQIPVQGMTRKKFVMLVALVCLLAFHYELGHWLLERELITQDPNKTASILRGCWRNDSSYSINTPQGLWRVEYGYRGDNLSYAVFQGQTGAEREVEQLVHVSGIRRNITVTLRHPDGEEEPLPGKVTLMQYLDGKYSERDFKVTFAEFEAFIKSSPARYTIDALVDYVIRYRAGKITKPR